ncbi:hypothetical protein BP5796_01793 [Coleophoma crateriformis]|uniref:NAD-dependent epimerase/dehydratase domain-containing protein n=1 Tax=Coleophoma crateriformis TaxID=565419 RepID=A0A3D8T1M0_9HELO|nr:hypothetical protein BP5796_01793 [Coleophoma crateriformis]
MHLIVTGATGLIGSAVLHHLITTPAVSKVSILSRRPVPQANGHSKVHVYIHKDFTSYPPETLAQLKGAEGVVWAQGISVTQVSKDEYEKITYDYPLAFARACATLNPTSEPFKFVYVSGEGATTSPGRLTQRFGVVKGRAEAALIALGKEYPNLKVYSARPGVVDYSQHPEIHEYVAKRSNLMKVAEKVMFPAARRFLPSQHSPTKELALVLTQLAMGDGKDLTGAGISDEGRIASNAALREMAALA